MKNMQFEGILVLILTLVNLNIINFRNEEITKMPSTVTQLVKQINQKLLKLLQMHFKPKETYD